RTGDRGAEAERLAGSVERGRGSGRCRGAGGGADRKQVRGVGEAEEVVGAVVDRLNSVAAAWRPRGQGVSRGRGAGGHVDGDRRSAEGRRVGEGERAGRFGDRAGRKGGRGAESERR